MAHPIVPLPQMLEPIFRSLRDLGFYKQPQHFIPYGDPIVLKHVTMFGDEEIFWHTRTGEDDENLIWSYHAKWFRAPDETGDPDADVAVVELALGVDFATGNFPITAEIELWDNPTGPFVGSEAEDEIILEDEIGWDLFETEFIGSYIERGNELIEERMDEWRSEDETGDEGTGDDEMV